MNEQSDELGEGEHVRKIEEQLDRIGCEVFSACRERDTSHAGHRTRMG
jgi:hypothetical protein